MIRHAEGGEHPVLCADDVLITPELSRRPFREPDHAAENRALTILAEEMASRPGGVLQVVAELARELCRADSAGISVLESGGENGVFRWHAATGAFAAHLHGTMPREASPCGTVMNCRQVLLFNEGERFFPALRGMQPRIYENLLALWMVDGEPAGALWVIHHWPEGRFDAEDARLLASLARFASAAYRTATALHAARADRQSLEQRMEERTRALRRSEEKYRTLFESIDQGFCIIEVVTDEQNIPVDYRFLEVNPVFEAQTGLVNTVGRRMREMAPAHEQFWIDTYGRIARTGMPERFEHRAEALGRWYEVYAFRIGAPEERQIAVLFHNITPRKRTEEALRESEGRFRAMVTATSYSVYRMSPDWSEMRQLAGQGFLSDTDAPTTTWLTKYIPSEDQPHVRAAIQEAIRARSLFELEHRVRRLDGSLGWTLSRAVPLLGADGEITEWFGAASDVTARKEAETRQAFLLKLSDALRPLADTRTIQGVACRLLGEYLGANHAYYVEIHEAQNFAIVEQDYVSGGAPSLIRTYPLSAFRWVVPLYKLGRPVIVTDLRTSDLVPEADREAMVAAQVIAWIAVPLVKRGELVGALCVAEGKQRAWTDLETELTRETAERIWAAIERTRAEAALRESETRARALIANLPGGAAFIVDHELRYQMAEGEAFRAAGLTADAFIGRKVDEAVGLAQAEAHTQYFRQALAGAPFELEHAVHGRVFLTRGVPLRDEEGNVYAALAVSIDVTEHRRAEAALRESEGRFRLLVENVQEYALFQSDLKGLVTSWNQGAERLFGYTSAEMLGQSASRLFTPEDRDARVLDCELAQVIAGGRPHDTRPMARKNGTRFWAQWVTEAVHDEEGRLRGVVKVLRDETERKRAEERQTLLIGELNHRVRNTLAIVQSIASQTLRGAADPAQFVEKFQARLQALSRAHALLTRRSWESADVTDIVRDQLTLDGEAERILCSGPSAFLAPQSAVAFALVLHELGTNARKYGALSVSAGRLSVRWKVQAGEPVLRMEWTETGGPPVRPPERRGFGTALIEKSLQGVGGTAELRFDPGGLLCLIQVPLASQEDITTNSAGVA